MSPQVRHEVELIRADAIQLLDVLTPGKLSGPSWSDVYTLARRIRARAEAAMNTDRQERERSEA